MLLFNLIFLGYSNLLALPSTLLICPGFLPLLREKEKKVQIEEIRVFRFKDSFYIVFSILSCILYELLPSAASHLHTFQCSRRILFISREKIIILFVSFVESHLRVVFYQLGIILVLN